jgi:hypothetical protein
MNLDNQTDKLFLQKVAQFAKISVSALERLDDKVEDLETELLGYRKKEAQEDLKKVKLEGSLEKAARALYDADFLTDETERRKFLKRAKEEPSYLVDVLIKVCNAADVALIGSPARVASKPKQAEYDPVAARAFGWSTSDGILDE